MMSKDNDIEEGKTPDPTDDGIFVDYIPPPPLPLPPPAKYKLWLMVFVCVYISEWLSSEAGYLLWLREDLRLSFDGALFIVLGSIVSVLLYGGIDILVFVGRVKINGEWRGLSSWMKQPRIKWVYEYENSFVDLAAMLVGVLEDGFGMFTVPPPNDKKSRKAFECKSLSPNQPVMLRIENRVRPDKIKEYQEWRQHVVQMGCHARPGMTKVKSESTPEGDYYVTYFTFSSVDYLNDFMTSPVRERLVRNLQPLLETPSHIQLLKNRVLPDAFTDLCNQQGHQVPKRLPKKWKVCLLTTLGLFLVLQFTRSTLPHYYGEWKLDDTHIRVESIVTVFINTFLNSYVMTPFMTMLFGHWLKRSQDEQGDQREPWRTLNDGFTSIWSKLAFCSVFYVGCALAWILKSS